MSLLTLVLMAPLAGFLLILLLPKDSPETVRRVTLGISIAIFGVSLGLLGSETSDVNLPWIPSANIRFHLMVDGLSMWLVLLSTFLTPIAVLISWKYIDKRVPSYYALLLLLEFGVIGVFLSMDLFLFYVFLLCLLFVVRTFPQVTLSCANDWCSMCVR